MELHDQIVVITGAAAGIGRALALRIVRERPARIICADIDVHGATETARLVDGVAMQVDVAQDAQIAALIDGVETDIGPIGLFCSNAGIMIHGGCEVPDADWQRIWDINVMAHVRAARYLVPLMAARGGGYLLNTASAAGLLNQIGAAPYGVSKHAAVGLAEWLAISHSDQGIKVSVLCPQAVRSDMLHGDENSVAAIDGIMEPDIVAETCVQAIRDETFLILPHAEVLGYMRNKAVDYDRWIAGMRRLNRRFCGSS